MRDIDLADIEDLIYDQQESMIRSKYGAEEAVKANYGWGVDEREEVIVVETKVYGPNTVLVSTGYLGSGNIEHEWRDR